MTVAKVLRKHFPVASIILLKKEATLAMVCAEGVCRMKEFAAEHGINCRHAGKITSSQDLPVIDRLLNNAQNNSIRAERLDDKVSGKSSPTLEFISRVFTVWTLP